MIDDTIKKNQDQDVTDIDLGFVEKRKFRIGGDYNRILELNVSDLGITKRLSDGYPKLQKYFEQAQEKVVASKDVTDEQTLAEFAKVLMEIDANMREIIDYIFDTNASEVCAPSGTMYDPVGGEFRWQKILDKLSGLYTTGLHEELAKMKNKVENKTRKYTKKSKK